MWTTSHRSPQQAGHRIRRAQGAASLGEAVAFLGSLRSRWPLAVGCDERVFYIGEHADQPGLVGEEGGVCAGRLETSVF